VWAAATLGRIGPSSLRGWTRDRLSKLASALLSKGVISAAWYAILTGLALLFVGLALASVSGNDTPAGVAGVACLLAGLWQLEHGLRSKFQRAPSKHDES
jgi:hypothetical protein